MCSWAILYADQHQYERPIPEYVRALELNPNLPDAHFRLGTDYVHLGKRTVAKDEFAVYEKLRAQHMADVDKERAEVQQFVYSSKTEPSVEALIEARQADGANDL
jgi:tetratricopeptide (TPR) repeat protein